MKNGYYYSEFSCVSCNKILSSNDIFYSNATCPYCGHVSKLSSTITDTKKKVYKAVRVSPWWMFWKNSFKKEYV